MSRSREETLAGILNLCESDPDAGLKLIEQIEKNRPEAESDPFAKLAKAMAYGSKGLFQLLKDRPNTDFTAFGKKELKGNLGVTEKHMDYLEKGLKEIEKMERIHSGALRMLDTEEDRIGESKVDAMAMVVERCRPGRGQQILGKTKLLYFGHERIIRLPQDTLPENRVEDLPLQEQVFFMKTFFSCRHIVKSALPTQYGKDVRGRKYIDCMLFERTPDDPLPGETVAEALKLVDSIYLFDNGTFSDTLEKT